jgi:diguanylate cyclase (GGDEF)-like protein
LTASFPRDLAAAGRDRAAERRDQAARVRDERAAAGAPLSPDERRVAARDREAAARDRRAAAEDRKAAHREFTDEGVDELTGVLRRGVGLAAIDREIGRAERTGDPLVVAFVDTVGLKETNDTKGHGEGDRVLREVADSLTADLRSYDVVARVGGDEFVCALSGETIEQAAGRYEQIFTRLTERGNGVSITVGLAAHRPGDTLETLIDRADQAMLAIRRRKGPR